MATTPILLVFLALVVAALIALARLGRNFPRAVSILSRIVIAIATLFFIAIAANLLTNNEVTITAPISGPSISLPPNVTLEEGPVATMHWGNFSEVTVGATDLSASAKALLILGALASAVTLISVCLVVDRLARSLSASDPFVVGEKALRWTSWIVLFGGITSEVLNLVGSHIAARDLFWVTVWSATGDIGDVASLTELGWPQWQGLSIPIPFWPIGAAIVLALLAAVFRYGAQLRRDAEGLV